MDDERTQSRIAELAMELMGADAARSFIDKIWESASPQVRQALADAVVARVTATLSATEFHTPVSRAVEDHLRDRAYKMAEEEFEKLDLEPLRADVAARIAKAVPRMFENVVTTIQNRAASEVVSILRRLADSAR